MRQREKGKAPGPQGGLSLSFCALFFPCRCVHTVPYCPAELKFGIGDGKLRYYLYNWRVAKEMQANEVGLVML